MSRRRYFLGLGAVVLITCALAPERLQPQYVPATALGALVVAQGQRFRLRLLPGEAASLAAASSLIVLWLLGPLGAWVAVLWAWLLLGLDRRIHSRRLTAGLLVTLVSLAAAHGAQGLAAATGQPLEAAAGTSIRMGLIAGGSRDFPLSDYAFSGVIMAFTRAFLVLVIRRFYPARRRLPLQSTGFVQAVWGVASAGLGLGALWGYRWLGEHFLPGLVLLLAAALTAGGSLHRLLFRASVRRLLLRLPRYGPSRSRAQRLVRYADLFGRRLGLTPAQLRDLRYAALVHDIDLPETHRPGPLTSREWDRVKGHPTAAEARLRRTGTLNEVADTVRQHHERWDGRGYPDGRWGEAIHLCARILHILEVFDALTTARDYREPISVSEALEELRRVAGSQLDPVLTTEFSRMVEEHREDFEAAVRTARGETLQVQLDHLVEGLRSYVSARSQAGGAGLERSPDASPRTGTASEGERAFAVSALYRLAQMVNATLQVDEVLDRSLQTIRRLTGCRCWAVLPGPGGGDLRIAASAGWKEDVTGTAISLNAAPGPEAMATRRPVAVEYPAGESGGDSLRYPFLGEGRWWVLSVPLVRRGRALGTLEVARWNNPFHSSEVELLSLVAGATALAVDNAMLYEETERRLQEISDLKRSTDSLLHNMTQGILVCDGGGVVILINEKGREMLGWAGLDWRRLLGRRLAGLEGGNPLAELMERVRRTHTGLVRPDVVLRGPVRKVLSLQVFPVAGRDGRLEAVVASCQDVTEQRLLEEQVQRTERLAALGQLAAGAAHEIRNPLTAVKGFLQLMQEELESERDNLDLIVGEIERIEHIVEDLLVLARPPAPRLEPVDVNRLVQKVGLLLEARARQVQSEVLTDLDRGLPPVPLDDRQIRQVLLNLGMNALEAMPGGGRLTFRTAFEEEPGQVLIEVGDEGAGVDDAVRRQMFDPFFTTKPGGTGLGLSVSDSIVRAHGGQINVYPGRGRGLLVQVRLPCKGDDPVADHAPTRVMPSETARGGTELGG